MFRCNECGTQIDVTNHKYGDVIECDLCGIELEIAEHALLRLQLGPSEE